MMTCLYLRWLRSVFGRIAFCMLLLFQCQNVIPTRTFAATTEILTPRSGSTILARHPRTHMVVRQPGSGEESRIKVRAGAHLLEPVLEMEDGENTYLHFRIPLIPGENTLTLLPGGELLTIRYQEITTSVPATVAEAYRFHQDGKLPESCAGCHELRETSSLKSFGLEGQASCAICHPDISEATFLHGPVANGRCLSCHQQSAQPWDIGFPPGRIEEVCFACHTEKSAWLSRKYIHGPVIVGGCTLCHDPHGGDHRYFLWAEGAKDLCITCHSDKENLLNRGKGLDYVHEIIPGSGCVICHDPHATDNLSVLHKPINKLCVSCHNGMAGMERGHPVSGHPVAGPREHRRPRRELSCASCHDPHESSYRYLLVGEPMEGQICRVCHGR